MLIIQGLLWGKFGPVEIAATVNEELPVLVRVTICGALEVPTT